MKKIMIRIVKGIAGFLFAIIIGILIIVAGPFAIAWVCFVDDIWPPFKDFNF